MMFSVNSTIFYTLLGHFLYILDKLYLAENNLPVRWPSLCAQTKTSGELQFHKFSTRVFHVFLLYTIFSFLIFPSSFVAH